MGVGYLRAWPEVASPPVERDERTGQLEKGFIQVALLPGARLSSRKLHGHAR
jgi:hypothetical protein